MERISNLNRSSLSSLKKSLLKSRADSNKELIQKSKSLKTIEEIYKKAKNKQLVTKTARLAPQNEEMIKHQESLQKKLQGTLKLLSSSKSSGSIISTLKNTRMLQQLTPKSIRGLMPKVPKKLDLTTF